MEQIYVLLGPYRLLFRAPRATKITPQHEKEAYLMELN